MKLKGLMLFYVAIAALISCTPGDEAPVVTDKYAVPEVEVPAVLCEKEYLGQTPMIIAYYDESSKDQKFDCYTHINYAHGRFTDPKTGSGGIYVEKPELLRKVVAQKQNKPSLKVLLMIGGWGAKADGFSECAKDSVKRADFCRTCKEIIDEFGLDGLDIDWEYPGGGPSTNGMDKKNDAKNFNILLKELRETVGTTKILSYASHSQARYVEWKGAMKYLDYINVMTYDMGDPPYHNSPLYYSKDITEDYSADQCIDLHVDKGIPLNRLNLGIPFYGHGTSPYDDDVKYNQMAKIWTDAKYEGKNIRKWDDVAKVPYLVDTEGKFLLGYDDEESIAIKGKYVLDKKLLGAMVWCYRHDDSNGTLRKALCTAIYGKENTNKE